MLSSEIAKLTIKLSMEVETAVLANYNFVLCVQPNFILLYFPLGLPSHLSSLLKLRIITLHYTPSGKKKKIK